MFHNLKQTKVLALAVFLVLGMLVATLHNDAVEKGRGLWLEDAIKVVVTPLQRGTRTVGGLFARIGQSFRSRNSLLRETKQLREEVRKLSLESSRLREAAEQNVRLRQSLGYKLKSPYQLLPAQVIYTDPSNWFQSCTIDRGRNSSVRVGSAVVTYRGLVGQVTYAGPTSSQVRMLTDQQTGVGATVQRSRVQGLVIGQSTDTLLMTYLTKDSDIKVGDIIVTSGTGGMVPKGLTIGRVIRIRREGVTKIADVRPTVKPETIEYVFVIPPQD